MATSRNAAIEINVDVAYSGRVRPIINEGTVPAGFELVSIRQVGTENEEFLEFSEGDVLPSFD